MSKVLNLLDFRMDRSRLSLRVVGVPDDTFGVSAMVISDHAMSGHFRIQLTVHAEAAIDSRLMIHAPAMVTLESPREPQYFHGRVIQCHCIGSDGDRTGYSVWIASPLAGAARRQSHRIFRHRSVPDMVTEILAAPDPMPFKTRWRLRRTCPVRPYTAQRGETDLAFINRQLADVGIFYYWEQTATAATLVFSDDSKGLTAAPGIELRYIPQAGTHRLLDTVSRLHPEAWLVPETIAISDYNDRTPETPIQSACRTQAPEPRFGIRHVIAADAPTIEAASTMAAGRMIAADACRTGITAESDCMAAAPGRWCALSGHPDPERNGNYLIVQVTHHGDQRSGPAPGAAPKSPTYHNRMVLIPASRTFAPEPRPAPVLPESCSAMVETAGGPDAHVDDQGDYRLRFHFDREKSAPATASEPLRLLQPVSGRQCGSHLPLHGGTQAVVVHTHDHPDRPYILGALPSPSTKDPVTSANRTEHRLHTRGRNRISLEDGPPNQGIRMTTADDHNRLMLLVSADGDRIDLATDTGDMALKAGKNMVFQSANTQSVTVGRNQTIQTHHGQHLVTHTGDLTAQGATHTQLHASASGYWSAAKGRHCVAASRQFHARANGSWSLRTSAEPLICTSDQQKLSVAASGPVSIVGTGGGPLTITQSGGGIEIATNGSLACGGGSVTINAAAINFYSGGAGGPSAAGFGAAGDVCIGSATPGGTGGGSRRSGAGSTTSGRPNSHSSSFAERKGDQPGQSSGSDTTATNTKTDPTHENADERAPNETKWVTFVINEDGDCEGLKCIAHFDDGTKIEGSFDNQNSVTFTGITSDTCHKIEIEVPQTNKPSKSISETMLEKILMGTDNNV